MITESMTKHKPRKVFESEVAHHCGHGVQACNKGLWWGWGWSPLKLKW